VGRYELEAKDELEARAGIEPAKKGFADLPLAAWVPRHFENHRFYIAAVLFLLKSP
jgi:hypothetical protein